MLQIRGSASSFNFTLLALETVESRGSFSSLRLVAECRIMTRKRTLSSPA